MNTILYLSSRHLRSLLGSVLHSELLEFWARQVHPLWSLDQPLAQIVAKFASAEDATTLWLKPNRHVVSFLAGQHLEFTVEVNGVRLTRSYSPSRVAKQPHLIAITVKRVDGGAVSTCLEQDSQIGDVLTLGHPYGQMVLPQQPLETLQPMVLLAAGSGITPMISLLRDRFAGTAHPVHQGSVKLLYWVRHAEELCFAKELQQLAEQHSALSVQIFLTGDDQALTASVQHWGYGRIHAAQLAHVTADWSAYRVYACGPAGFVQSAEQILAGQAAVFLAEAFSLPQAISLTAAQTVQVTLSKQNRVLEIPLGQALLPALEAAGVAAKHGCRMGICHRCVCVKTSGSTQHVVDGRQSSESNQTIQICVQAALSDLILDL